MLKLDGGFIQNLGRVYGLHTWLFGLCYFDGYF